MAGHKSKRNKIKNGSKASNQKPSGGASKRTVEGGGLAEDVHQVWVLASNCAIYENDPGPVAVNIGTESAPTMVSWSESWRISYARHVLTDLDVDAARINAAGAECVSKSGQTGDRDYTLAAELCRRAASMAEQAGADRDEGARRRLEVVAGFHNHVATFAMMGLGTGDLVEDARREMEAELRALSGGPDLATLTAVVTGVSSAAAAGPAPSAERVVERFDTAGSGPRVRELLVDEPTHAMLGPEALAEIAASLWAVDCQTCGRALDGAPALKLQRLPGERIAAGLHHPGCVPTVVDWTSTGASQLPDRRHNSWTSRSLVMTVGPGSAVPGGYPMLMVNPSLENVGLRQDSAGRWRVDVASDFDHLGLMSPAGGAPDADAVAVPRVDRAVARVTGDSIAITMQDPPHQTFEAAANAAVREAVAQFGGVLLVATHDVWLADLQMEQMDALWSSDKVRVGMVGLHGTERPRQAAVDATFVLQWNPKILTAGFEIATTGEDFDEQQAKDWAAAAITTAATGDVVLIDWQPSNKKQPADGWFVLDAIATNMYALRRTEDGTWRVSRCLSRHERANDYTDNEAKAWAAQVLERHGVAGLKWAPGPTTAGSQTLYALTRKGE